ncbi:MAG: hypothetical protein R2855_16320 [Thermomicrobiales bacterium]
MSSRWSDITRDDLELELAALGARLDWSPTPDLAESILATQAAPTPLPRARHRRHWLAAAALVLLIVGALLAGSATVRTSVADFLGIDGVRIEFGEPPAAPVETPNLGTPTSMQDFVRWLPFAPMQPAALDQPDALYLHVLENGDVLGLMAWPPDDALPQAAETGLGALLMQFEPPDDIYMMIKTVGTSTGSITETTVNGEPAWWIEVASNLTIFGEESIDSRSTANVLLWQQGDIGFRLESALSMDEALAIAESLEPVS